MVHHSTMNHSTMAPRHSARTRTPALPPLLCLLRGTVLPLPCATMPPRSSLLLPSSLFLPLLLLLATTALATTIDIDGVEEAEGEEGEARTVFTSGGTYYIALNTTFLLYYSLVAAALLLAGLALSGAFSGEAAGYGQQYGQYRNRRSSPGYGGESWPSKK